MKRRTRIVYTDAQKAEFFPEVLFRLFIVRSGAIAICQTMSICLRIIIAL